MQITRQQEIAMWKLLAKALNLIDLGDSIYMGKCPFCKEERVFGLNIEKNYTECLSCGKRDLSLVSSINSLIYSASSSDILFPSR